MSPPSGANPNPEAHGHDASSANPRKADAADGDQRPPSQSMSLAEGLRRSGLTETELWHRYATIGGNGTPDELRTLLSREASLDSYEHDLIAQALNEAFIEQGNDHPVAYRRRTARPD